MQNLNTHKQFDPLQAKLTLEEKHIQEMFLTLLWPIAAATEYMTLEANNLEP